MARLRNRLFEGGPAKKLEPAGLEVGGKKDISREQEDRVAKRTGGRRVPGSGAMLGRPGDVDHKDFLFEAKTTGKFKSIGVRQDWLEKIDKEATMAGKTPALVLSFPNMGPNVDRDWVMVPQQVFNRLFGEEIA